MIGIWKAVIVGGSIVIGSCIGWIWKGAKDDNPIEEIAELVIEYETGYDFDLTPSSKEDPQGDFDRFIAELEKERQEKKNS